jgi:hypothetical protein
VTTYSIEKLSGSTDGKGVKVAATSTPGTTIHTATSGAGDIDLVSLWAVNNDADGETRTLALEWGTTTAADGNIVVNVPCKAGPVFICDRLPIMNSLVVTAFADETNDVLIFGHVQRVDV